jgi:hypothetical protein
MNQKTKLILAQMQVENIYELLSDGPYAAFFASHLLPVKFEIDRQMSLLTKTNYYTKIEES